MEPLLQITPDMQGQRLDVVLAHAYPRLSRAYLQKVTRRGDVTLRGAPQRPSYRVRAGETFSIPDFQIPISGSPLSTSVSLGNRKSKMDNEPRVLYEDEDLLVIDKPAGLVVHPAPSYYGPTLVDWLKGYRGGALARSFPDPDRLGLVHRLDKETSGVLVIAKNVVAQTALARQFQNRQIEKTYAAFVEGVPASSSGYVSAPVGRSRKSPARMTVTTIGRPSETTFDVVASWKEVAQLRLHPKTGRTHQIRVHLAAIGHPVVGDSTYGAHLSFSRSHGIRRPLLHAERLQLRHPATGKLISFNAPWPEDFHRARRIFRQIFRAVWLVMVGTAFLAGPLPADQTSNATSSKSASSVAGSSGSSSTSSTKTTHHRRPVSSAAFSELTLEVRHLRQELEALKEKVNATNASLDQLSVSQRLHDLEQAVADINGKTVGSSNSLEEVKTQTLEIGRRLKDQQTQLGQLRDQIYRLQQQIQQSNTPSPPVAAPAAGGVSTDQGKRP